MVSFALNSLVATDKRASLGHRSNQSMVQQLMMEGNWRQRFRNFYPTGEKASTMCRFCLAFWLNSFIRFSRVSTIFSFSLLASALISFKI